jgi:predicted MFS family arabinose efflux permease
MPTPPDDRPGPDRVRAVAALIAAVFVISVSFGLNMPLLPRLIGTVADGGVSVSLHAGFLAAVFTFALGAGAPLFGTWSDRIGRRRVLLLGMVGFTTTMAVYSPVASLAGLYAEQLLSGLSAAAVLPTASAFVADLAPDDGWRARRLAWVNMALVAGFILGPVVGSAPDRLLLARAGGVLLVLPFTLAAAAGLGALALTWRWLPHTPPRRGKRTGREVVRSLLGLTFAVSLAVGVFEVAIAIRGGEALGFDPGRLGVLFATCSILMFASQALVFSRRVRASSTAMLLGPAFIGLAAGLAAAGFANSFSTYAAAVGLFAVSGGVLVPVLAYWVSRNAGGAQGAQLGRQTASAGLGQAAGSALAGVTFGSAAAPGLPLWAAAGAMGAVALVAWRVGARLRAGPDGVQA